MGSGSRGGGVLDRAARGAPAASARAPRRLGRRPRAPASRRCARPFAAARRARRGHTLGAARAASSAPHACAAPAWRRPGRLSEVGHD